MTTLAEFATRFATHERPAGNLLDENTVLAQALAATRFYAGYAIIRARDIPPAEPDEDPVPVPPIDGELDIGESEWAIIRPLFLLYVERETALQLEASRGMGVDPFGRSASEISGDIAQQEMDLPHKAFFHPIVTV
jgi:hypothetical protein